MKRKYLNYIELDKKNLIHNINTIKKALKKNTSLMPIVKSNAYGHGMKEIVSILEKLDIFGYGVNSIDEACELRSMTSKRIICLGGILNSDLAFAVENYIEPVVYRLDTLNKLNKLSANKGVPVKVHLKVETGTNRQGILFKDIYKFINFFKSNKNIKLEGMNTHFANIEDTTDHSYAMNQLVKFREFLGEFKRNGLKPVLKHTACSAASLLFKNTHFNLVRAGISMYGFWSSTETHVSSILKHGDMFALKPVLTWKTRIVQIKTIEEGCYVSYGCTYRTTKKTKIAVIPVGYYDGYDRKLSNRGWVIIKGIRAPICGRVCMNMFMVDVTHIKGVKAEDEVILIGESNKEKITADDIADMIDTINYEVVTKINPVLPRIIKE